MHLNKNILFITIFILAISGFHGFLIEEGLININKSILNFLLDILLIVIAIFSYKDNVQIRQSFFICLTFLILTGITYALNASNLTIINYLNGLREFIPYFLFPIIYLNILKSKWRDFFIKKFNTFLYLFLAIQIPVSLYQFSINGAGDFVGGTQGSGFSGILTFIIFLSTYYLMIQNFNENNIFNSFLKKSYLLIFWIPVFINETKISYILIPLFLILLIRAVVSNFLKYLGIAIILIPFLFLFNSIYQKVTTDFDSRDFLTTDFLEQYLASDDDQQSDISRFQKLTFFMTNFSQKEIFFGKGIGQFKGGTTLEPTPFATMYDWLLQGSIPMLFFLMVQIGIIGTIIFLFYWIKLITSRYSKQRVNYSSNLIIFATACFLIIQMYNDAFRSLFFCGVIIYIICYAISPPLTRKHQVNIHKMHNEL